ncbi:MAG: hypothetical protein ACXVCN_11360 [Bdellovibrio sp.]
MIQSRSSLKIGLLFMVIFVDLFDICSPVWAIESCENVFTTNNTGTSANLATPRGLYYLPESDPIEIDRQLIDRRVKKVLEVENRRRLNSGFPLFNQPRLMFSNSIKDGFFPGLQDWRGLNTMGGPELNIGNNFILARPWHARETQNLQVYIFSGDEITKVLHFREFAVSKIPGDTVLLSRIIRGNPDEHIAWGNSSIAQLKQAALKYPVPQYDIRGNYSFHFSVGDFYIKPEDSALTVQFEVSKEFLLRLAREGKIEVGTMAGPQAPVEIMVLEDAWTDLMQFPMTISSRR